MSAHVLVVDDVEANRYLQATWLRRAGYQVTEAATGEEALARLSPDMDVVILDVNLPDMSGFDVCARIKANQETAGVPVMHLSATAVDVASRTHGLDGGAEAYLVEPVDRAEFLATLRSLCRTRAARRVAERLARFVSATLPLSAAETLPHLLEAAASGAADVFDAPTIAVAQSEPGLVVRSLSAGRGALPVTRTGPEPLAPTWQATPLYLSGTQIPPAWRPLVESSRLEVPRWFLWPIPHPNGLVTGGLAIGLPPGQDTLALEEERMLGRLVDSMTVALTKLRAYAQEHRTALTLQRALLPERLPEVPGLHLAAHYIASSDGVRVGGDFYDVFVPEPGRVALVIGDVQGHSLQAATVMAELRFSLRAYLIEGHSPASVVALLNTLLRANHPDLTASLALVLLDQEQGTIDVANAGHLPPLLMVDGQAGYIEEHGVLLGPASSQRPSTTLAMPPGALLVLVTDGLLERRGESIDVGLAALCETVVAMADAEPGAVADRLLDRFTRHGVEDDVAILIARRQG